jgi:hypothetical protein
MGIEKPRAFFEADGYSSIRLGLPCKNRISQSRLSVRLLWVTATSLLCHTFPFGDRGMLKV